ncbi:hypothetical protein GYMLUDRAFT_436626 [Collybiopsis luxurians FD-317 M1]|uniref:Unplaced genomic scaffold GYMLUscaffold_14, whole genome shotgun sequence n=1 Tax=Collybiopsis luxurians FD-317 M1 TaxID=944289 RepID=A0A0D0C7P1_9AGAR|nr:hypothetical protein GYMLUDRAFT_436626 [Collybiopsis luxurians FD-317 M1]
MPGIAIWTFSMVTMIPEDSAKDPAMLYFPDGGSIRFVFDMSNVRSGAQVETRPTFREDS